MEALRQIPPMNDLLAADELAEFRHLLAQPFVAKILEAVLAETDEQYILVRYEAAVRLAVHLGEESSTKTIDVLVAYLNDHGGQVCKGSRVRVSRYGAEAKTGDSEVKQLGSDDPRWMPAYALGLIGRKADRPDVIRGLEEVAKADDAKVREKAREALASIRKKD